MMSNPVSSAELLAKLRIIRSAGIGPVTYKKLLQRHGSAERAVAAWPTDGGKSPGLCDAQTVLRELENLQRADGTMLVWGEENYPPQLAELPDAPIVLSVLGDVKFLHARHVAIVGNRNASAAGMAWSKALAQELAHAQVGVVSGLARGIDTAAHEGALSGNGVTIAVVAGGVDHIYPPENAKLREKIIEHGCVVSEQAWGMAPTASLFPRRNRIIAGLSVGVAVSEATRHSGSLITAECALNYGRDVWAVPGSPSDPRSGGPNWLLKNGATLIEGAADILTNLPVRAAPYVASYSKAKIQQPDLFAAEESKLEALPEIEAAMTDMQRVFGLLGAVPTTFDELVRQSAVSETALNGLLIELELDGHALREADGRWRRT
jgi:DNA processing protein